MALQDDLRNLTQKQQLIIGYKETLRSLNKQGVTRILLAANCPKGVKEDIEHLAQLAKVEVEQVDVTNDDLGTLVKKPFAVSVIGVKRP